MLRRTLDYLRVGWEMLGHLHLAHWILLILISLFPASATSAFLALAGEHSTFFLCVVFLLCFSLMSLMILALLGHPVQASSRDRRVIANTPISTESPATESDQLPRPLRLRVLACRWFRSALNGQCEARRAIPAPSYRFLSSQEMGGGIRNNGLRSMVTHGGPIAGSAMTSWGVSNLGSWRYPRNRPSGRRLQACRQTRCYLRLSMS